MIKRMLCVLSLSVLTACGSHHYRVDGDHMTLILTKPEAKTVVFFCSVDGFVAHPATHLSGRWEVSVPAGEAFSYFYWVDDKLFIPDCPAKETDDFGSENCIYDPQG